MIVKKGTMGKVKEDSLGNFNPGDEVVALEDDEIPYCCLKENYKGLLFSPCEYPFDLYFALSDYEVDWEVI